MNTKHNLDFEVCDWEPLPGFLPSTNFMRFRVGTCEGLWSCTSDSYDILAIDNKSPGNGHFDDVLEWFESSCRRDKKNLKILEIMNKPFMKHLIQKRGFKKLGHNNVIMKFKDKRQNKIIMTKQEAREAIERGEKLSHEYFTDEEFITIASDGSGRYQCEMGYLINPAIFWTDRRGAGFDNGWKIFQG